MKNITIILLSLLLFSCKIESVRVKWYENKCSTIKEYYPDSSIYWIRHDLFYVKTSDDLFWVSVWSESADKSEVNRILPIYTQVLDNLPDEAITILRKYPNSKLYEDGAFYYEGDMYYLEFNIWKSRINKLNKLVRIQ